VVYPALELREEKHTFAKVEGANVGFFLVFSFSASTRE
jgi:hypothetical protein